MSPSEESRVHTLEPCDCGGRLHPDATWAAAELGHGHYRCTEDCSHPDHRKDER